jgi:anti-sigma B factor antagonist
MERSSAIVIQLPEDFGKKEARKLRRELEKILGSDRPSLVLDLSRVKAMDSEGIEALLRCMEQVATQDGALRIVGMSPEAATLLELTRLDRLFANFPGFSVEVPSFALSPEPVGEAVESESSVQLPATA